MKAKLKKILAAPFVFLAAIFVLLEDWLWDDLLRLAAAIGRLPVFRQIEMLIATLPPYAALAMFAMPSLLLIPVKLTALWFIAHGQPAMGFLTAAAAKVVGTALVARIFSLTKPKLLSIHWFAWLHDRFLAFKVKVYAFIKATKIYQAVHVQSVRLKARVKAFLRGKGKAFWRKRWDAARRLTRRWKQPEESE
ncbi:MAG: hypothetical protein JST84_23620 [Acidobacteria bacterium]|nr:hypothetical protein [Acidobacteriota bacterium]